MPNLLFNALLSGVGEVARAKGIQDFSVQHKRNAKGELVVALIIRDKEGPLARVDVHGAVRPVSRRR